MTEMLTLDAFEEASQKVKEVTQETKLVESPYFSAQCGNRVWLKPREHAAHGRLQGARRVLQDFDDERRGARSRHHHG